MLTHGPRENSPGNSLTLFPWCWVLWHPLLSEAHSQGLVSVVGAGAHTDLPLGSVCPPQLHFSQTHSKQLPSLVCNCIPRMEAMMGFSPSLLEELREFICGARKPSPP